MSCRGCRYDGEGSDHPVCQECLEDLHEYKKWTPVIPRQKIETGKLEAQLEEKAPDNSAPCDKCKLEVGALHGCNMFESKCPLSFKSAQGA